MTNIAQILKTTVLQLTGSQNKNARLDAELLLAYILGKSRSYLYTYPDLLLTANQLDNYQNMVNKRLLGIPLAYLTGYKDFWSLSLKVTKDTLIPRPETEQLIETVLELLATNKHAQILDLGTGTGAIALALAKEKPHWRIDACDKSQAALKIAEENALLSGIKHVKFFHSDWFTKLPKKQYHAILSNPPYIAENDPHLLLEDIRFEPRMALVSGEDGMYDFKQLINTSRHYLLTGGLLILEHGYNQKMALKTLLLNAGYSEIECWQDWQGNDRVIKAVWYNT